MNIGSRPNIELGGAAVAADAMTDRVRHLAEPAGDHNFGHTGAPKMPTAAPVSAADASRSTSPPPMRGGSVNPKRSPGTGIPAQNP
jgi:hypothetical protein